MFLADASVFLFACHCKAGSLSEVVIHCTEGHCSVLSSTMAGLEEGGKDIVAECSVQLAQAIGTVCLAG